MPNKGVIYIGDVSGNLGTINSSGQLRVEASVSIPPVNANVSGNMVYLPNDGVNNVVSISGQTVVASVNVAANVSGNTIYLVNDSVNNITKISGQLVAVSGLINARVSGSVSVSGNAIYLVNDGVNNVVSISGQTVVASVVTNISGQVVAVSGNVVYLIDDSVRNKVKISGQTVRLADDGTTNRVVVGDLDADTIEIIANTSSDDESTVQDALVTAAFGYGYNAQNDGWNRLRTTNSGDGFRLIVSISGQPVTGTFNVASNISGNTVYLVSGHNEVQTNSDSVTTLLGTVVPLAVNLVDDGVNNVVKISGQTVIASVSLGATPTSGDASRISGQTIYIIDDSVNNKVKISGQTVSVSGSISINNASIAVTLPTTPTSGDAARVSGQTVYLVDDSVNNKIKISGQLVAVSGIVNIGNTVPVTLPAVPTSGDAARISGQTIYIIDDSVNNKIKISGQLVAVSGIVNIGNSLTIGTLPTISVSGSHVSVSGTVVSLSGSVTQISGQLVSVSGTVQTLSGSVTQISGQSVRLPNDGVNNVVSISGQTVVASVSMGPTPTSGDASRISGQTIYLVNDSVNNITKISGQLVAVSGVVTINPLPPLVSGDAIRISGQTIYLVDDSVNNRAKISGQLVAVSGIVAVNSLPVISISGNMVSVSGQPARISGETVSVSGIVQDRVPTALRTRALLACSAASGGTALLSGDVKIATLINAGVSGTVMYIGSATDPPFSGKGIYLTAGNGYTCEIDNFNRLQVCAFASGQLLSYGGVAY